MKKILTSAFAILIATAAVQAQTDSTAPHHEHHDMHNGGGMYKQLNLTTEQQAKMKTLRDEFKKQADALKEQKLTEEERRTQLQNLRQQQETEMKALLTPAQQAQWEKLRSERNENRQDGKRNGDSTHSSRKDMNGRNGAGLQKELNLTSAQQEKMKALRSDFKAKAETLRNDKALTAEQKRTKLQELRKQQQEQMKTVLTKEQQEKLQTLRQERAARNTR